MPLGIRLSVVAFVLLIGVGSAMLFRKQPTESASTDRSTPDPLLLRKAPTAAARPATVVRAAKQTTTGAPREVSVLRNTPDRKVIPPPDIDTSFNTPLMPKRPKANGASPGSDVPERLPNPSQRVRIVVDGDSLKSLAHRYLGSSNRFMEIYEANLNVLSSHDMLPIGTRLKIPVDPPPAKKPNAKPAAPKQPAPPRMVPIN
jgi:nucleoid-associated protein YgaU